ncbi:MAG TPA: hypothetical protein VM051_07575 [Usitatibacter sp.]|nr:hypothetical protein [Usitatibacter sp.]
MISFATMTPSPVLAVVLTSAALSAHAVGYLEVPEPASTQTGIGVIAGWNCNARRIEVRVDEQAPMTAASGTERPDTAGVCGRTDTGFSILVNWNTLPITCFGCRFHRLRAYADGILFADATFEVEHFGYEYMTGKRAQYTLKNFPSLGKQTWVRWDEAKQNFSVFLTTRYVADSLSGGLYYGALFRGPQNPSCGPYSTEPRIGRHGSFRIDLSSEGSTELMSLAANYADGGSCFLARGVREPLDSQNRDGYIIANFDAASTASCPEFPGGLRVRIDGERLVADSLDNCATTHIVGANRSLSAP